VKRAVFRITLGGNDMTGTFKPRLMGMTLTECRGGEADQLDLTLDDADGKLAIPGKEEKIELQIGWEEEGLINKGSFIVDEVEHSGTPDQITLRARSADLLDHRRRHRHYRRRAQTNIRCIPHTARPQDRAHRSDQRKRRQLPAPPRQAVRRRRHRQERYTAVFASRRKQDRQRQAPAVHHHQAQ
jgi:hypothetical protein